ncbi:hypothetical protein RBH29_08040 [Herbivorax sp. ANBcel31]|uniref:hypothetical protein n=1 Tax=Herbivorax sp. ANBcel31 TaxID=3069754 RepID=UPI0027B0B5BB|nr:hypothetical protein [Herbivorax sp. ANBcel31]MDQ2086378.1 hypothetical protein [Herbivorax sp. ANBcel31]
MVEVYYYVPVEEFENAVECGLKLSKWHDKEVSIGIDKTKCISALLNPKDDIEKYNSDKFKCLKFELYQRYCYVADRYLYDVGLVHSDIMKLYLDSIMPIENYTFGLYRFPECLITSTIIGDQISILDKRLDSPVLFDNSEELYTNNIIEDYRDEDSSFNDTLLYHYYSHLVERKELKRYEDDKTVIFLDEEIERPFVIKKPTI